MHIVDVVPSFLFVIEFHCGGSPAVVINRDFGEVRFPYRCIPLRKNNGRGYE